MAATIKFLFTRNICFTHNLNKALFVVQPVPFRDLLNLPSIRSNSKHRTRRAGKWRRPQRLVTRQAGAVDDDSTERDEPST